MRIIAIDPGNEASAWCVVHDGVPKKWGKLQNDDLIELLRSAEYCDCRLAVEMIASYGMPVGREVFETCLWIGRFIQVWEGFGGDSVLIYRKDVKLFHFESVRATDANIRASLIDRFGPGKAKAIGLKSAPGPLYGVKGDCWAALAVGLTAAARVAGNALKAGGMRLSQ